MDWLSRSGLVVIVLLGLFMPARASGQAAARRDDGPRLVEASAASLVFELDVPLPAMDAVQVDGQVFQRLSLPGYTAAGAAGQPELLQSGVMLGIPADGDVALRIVDAKIEDLPGTYTVYPAPQHVVQRDPESGEPDALSGVQEQFTWDHAAYAADEFQPPAVVALDETAFVRGQRVARVLIRPVQYNPAQGALRVYRYLRVEATFSGAPVGNAQAAAAPDLFDPILRSQLLNFDQALTWRSARGAPVSDGRAPDSVYPGDTSRVWFKTNLGNSGLYKVTLDDLQGTDLAPLAVANPAYLQVWTHGEEVAAYFAGDGDAQFEAGEALLFYADIEPTIYSDTDVYWLSVGNSPGLRMTTANAAPTGAVTDTAAWATARLDEDNIFAKDLPPYPTAPPYPRWYWVELHNTLNPTFTVNLSLPHAVTSNYTAILRVRLQGGLDSLNVFPDHRVRIDLNGQSVGVLTWDGLTAGQQQFQVPAERLRSGDNSVTFTVDALPNVIFDRSFLDWVEIDYRHALSAQDDQVAWTTPAGGRREFELRGFSRQDVLAFDVTDPAVPVRLTGLQAAPLAAAPAVRQVIPPAYAMLSQAQVFLPLVQTGQISGGSAFTLRFGAAGAIPRSYAVTRLPVAASVPAISRDTGSALRAAGNRADYLLITHRELWTAAQALASHRRSAGLTVALIDIQDVYDEWSNGRMDPRAIRDFVAYAYAGWQAPAPSYLLLLGSSHYDYRMRTGLTTQPILVPTYFDCVDPFTCEVATENEFVAVSGADRMPDLAVGRLPARNLAEATVMVNKTISYETAPPPGSWSGTLAFVADNYRDASGAADPAGNFEALSQGTAALVPSQYTISRVFYDPYANDDGGEPYRYRTASTATDAIVAAVNGGAVFLNYIGHASVTTWAHEAILRARDGGRNDVTRLSNGGRLPIVLDMACDSGTFANPLFTGIEVMMLAWPAGGSVAGWAATGFGVATGHDQLHRGFYRAVFQGGVSSLGLATTAGKQALWLNGRNLDLLDTFDLLGDPALRINLTPAIN